MLGLRRTPVVQAETETECGAACLTMVLKHHRHDVSLREVHRATKVGRDGTTAKDLVQAARDYGLEATAVRVPLEQLGQIPLPAILHWEFSHFVVLERAGADGGAVVLDPAVDRVKVSAQEMDRSYTGVAVTLTPSPSFVARRSTEPSAWLALARRAFAADKVRRLMVGIGVVSLLATALGLVGPVLTKLLVDDVLPQRLDSLMPVVVAGVAMVTVVLFLSDYLRTIFVVQLANRADAELMEGFFTHLLALPYTFFQQRSVGDLVQRLSSNAQIRQVLTEQSVQSVLDAVLVLAFGVILFVVSPVFGVVTVVIGLIQTLLIVGPARRITRLTSKELAEVGRTQGFAIEVLEAIDTVKAGGAEVRMDRRFLNLLSDQIDASMRRSRFVGLVGSASGTVAGASPLVLTVVGAAQNLSGAISLGTMFGLIALAQQLLTPLTSLVMAAQSLQTVQGHVARLAAILVEDPEQAEGEGTTVDRVDGRVSLHDVGFRYDESGPWVFRHVDLDIEPGTRLALVGRSGEGKSTLARLIAGLHRPEEGRVTVDGHDLRDLDLASVRRQFGVVMQSPLVFNASIRDNITLVDDTVPLDDVEHAARLAALDDDIEAMPMRYETVVSEGGAAISGGQRQRLNLARALCRRPRLLLLDEATSSLDAHTERRVVEALREERSTTVVIAHRLTTVRDADCIVVLADGSIAERGTHEELMRLDGHYAELVRSQTESGPPAGADGERERSAGA